MNKIIREDIESIVKEDIPWEKLKDSTVLVTGFKGMLGSYFTKVCLYLNDELNYNIHVIGLEINDNRVDPYFVNHPCMKIIYQNVSEPFQIDEKVDWVLHAASPASPLIMLKDLSLFLQEKFMDNPLKIKNNSMKIHMVQWIT